MLIEGGRRLVVAALLSLTLSMGGGSVATMSTYPTWACTEQGWNNVFVPEFGEYWGYYAYIAFCWEAPPWYEPPA
jgi:hypothetical protein